MLIQWGLYTDDISKTSRDNSILTSVRCSTMKITKDMFLIILYYDLIFELICMFILICVLLFFVDHYKIIRYILIIFSEKMFIFQIQLLLLLEILVKYFKELKK